jgi:hypothetical protein
MDKIQISRFQTYDIRADLFRTSRRWGTREAVRDIVGGQVIGDSVIEVDANAVESDIPGLTIVNYDPKPRKDFR